MTRFARVLLVGFCASVATTPFADEDAARRISEAIDSMRGLDIDGSSKEEQALLSSRLDKAWKVLRENKSLALPAVRGVLKDQATDSALIIDLSSFLMETDPGDDTLQEIAGYLVKTDPNLYTRGFFRVTSYMAAKGCKPCIPAILKILEVRKLDGYFPEHAMSVGIFQGMVFTIGQYGDEIIDDVLPYMASDNCTVRHNAIMILMDLVPRDEPGSLQKIALEDSCSEARAAAWMALGAFYSPSREGLALQRLATDPSPLPGEKESIAFVMATVATGASRKALENLTHDADPNVAKAAREYIDLESKLPQPGLEPLDTRDRRKFVRQLERAARTGEFGSEPDRAKLRVALTPDDLPLVNRARAAVLRRLSDECLYEWYSLRHVAGQLRARAVVKGGNTAKTTSN